MKKIVFIDCDNTLMTTLEDGKGYIPESAILAIRKARKNNVLVYLCTGRSLTEIDDSLNSIGFDGIIGGSGSFLIENNNLVFHKTMSYSDVETIIKTLDGIEAGYMLESNKGIYANKILKDYYLSDPSTFLFGQSLMPISKESYNEINKVVYLSKGHTIEEINALLSKRFDVVGLSYGHNTFGGEISIKGISKGSGVVYVLSRLKIDKKDSYSIGDSYNDVSMFEKTGVSIAMKDCVEGLERIVDYQTDSIENDGIYKAFIRYQLIETKR